LAVGRWPKRGFAAEAHRSDSGLIGLLDDALLERGELGIGIDVAAGP